MTRCRANRRGTDANPGACSHGSLARTLLLAGVACAIVAACNGERSPPPKAASMPGSDAFANVSAPAAPTDPSSATAATTGAVDDLDGVQSRRCLPLLNGCGCADGCGDGFSQRGRGWGVVRPWGDSALDEVTRERRCFDSRGVSYLEHDAPAAASNCIDVFVAPMACGGECIPTTDFLRCSIDPDGGCGPSQS